MGVLDQYIWRGYPSMSVPLTADDDPLKRRITTPESAPNALTGDSRLPSAQLLATGQRGPLSELAYNLAGRPSMMPPPSTSLPPAYSSDSGGGGGAAIGLGGLLSGANQANNIYQQLGGILGAGGVSSSVGTGAAANTALADAGFGGSSAGVLGSAGAAAPSLGAGAASGAAAAGDAAAGVGAGASGAGGITAGGLAAGALITAIGPIAQNLFGDNKKHAISSQQGQAAQAWLNSQGITTQSAPNGQAAPFGIPTTTTTYTKNGQPFDYTDPQNVASFKAWAKANGYPESVWGD